MPWSDHKKWWMDLLKWVITSVFAVLGSYFVMDRLQDTKQDARNRADAAFRLEIASLQDFQSALATYEVAAVTAYTDLYQWRGKDKTAGMEWYERQAYAGLLLALADADNRFKTVAGLPDLLTSLRADIDRRHRLYDRWVDLRLDNEASTPISPGTTRAEFDSLTSQISARRAEIVEAVESELLPVER